MNCLIIGGSGFIGTEIINDIRFDPILVISRKNINIGNDKLILKDISLIDHNDIARIEEFQPEVVINAAWSRVGDYSFESCLSNINSHLSFINKISKIKSIKKYINFGSAWECDLLGEAVDERSQFQINSEFLLAKKIIYDYSNYLFAEKHLWLRLFYVFGDNQEKGLIKYVIKTALKSQNLQLKNPNSVVDYVAVKDVIEYIYGFCMKDVPGGIYNIGSGIPRSNIDIIKLIEEKINKKIILTNVEFNQAPTEKYWALMLKTEKFLNIKIPDGFDEEIDKIILNEKKKNCNI